MTSLIETYYSSMDIAKAIRSTVKILRDLKKRDKTNADKYEKSIKSLLVILRDLK